NDLMASLGYDPENRSTDVVTAAGVGNLVAAAVIAFRHHDGANQLGDLHPGAYSDYTGYAPVNDPDHINDPNRWQPLRISDGHGGTVTPGFIAPHWGRVVPFALTSDSQFRPPEVGNLFPFGGYRVQAEQILHYSARLTDIQKAIAEYWADGPNSELPAGHWMLFGQFVSQHDGHTLDQDVKLFFALANAAFGASATVRTGSSKVEPGAVPATDVTLSWATLADAANQAGISRRYGGIHFVQGDLQGRRGGRLVGVQVWAKALTYFNGTANP